MSVEQSLVSCIMANYNTEAKLLHVAIQSILNQTYDNFELIIVDDCSTNDSYQILLDYQKLDTRIKIFRNEKNRGLPYSLNKGISMANGEYIARMDTDDISLETRFQKQVEYFNKNPHIDICGTFVKQIGIRNTVLSVPFTKAQECKCQLLFSSCLYHPTVMIRSQFLNQYKLNYNEDYLCAQDYDLWVRCSVYGEIGVLDRVLLLYRVHSNQISSKKIRKQQEYSIEICKRMLKNVGIQEMLDEMIILFLGYERISEDKVLRLKIFIEQIIEANEDSGYFSKRHIERILSYRFFYIIIKGKITLFKKIFCLIKYDKAVFFNILTFLKQVILKKIATCHIRLKKEKELQI